MKLDLDFDKKREFEVGSGGKVKFRFRDIAEQYVLSETSKLT